MVRLFRKRQDKDLDAEILEDVDLSPIAKQKRKQLQLEERQEETETKTSEDRVSELRSQKPEHSIPGSSISEVFQEEFFEWLIEQALKNEDKYRKLLDSINSLGVEDLRKICRILLRKLREGS